MANQNRNTTGNRQDTNPSGSSSGSGKQVSGNQMDQQGRSQSGLGRNQQDSDQGSSRSNMGNRGTSDHRNR